MKRTLVKDFAAHCMVYGGCPEKMVPYLSSVDWDLGLAVVLGVDAACLLPHLEERSLQRSGHDTWHLAWSLYQSARDEDHALADKLGPTHPGMGDLEDLNYYTPPAVARAPKAPPTPNIRTEPWMDVYDIVGDPELADRILRSTRHSSSLLYRYRVYQLLGHVSKITWTNVYAKPPAAAGEAALVAAWCATGQVRPPENTTGVAAAYWLCCPPGTVLDEQVGKGWRAYVSAAEDTQKALAPYIQAELTPELILSSKSASIVRALKTLPWASAKEVLGASKVQGTIALRHLDPETRTAFLDSPSRPLKRRILTEQELLEMQQSVREGSQLLLRMRAHARNLRAEWRETPEEDVLRFWRGEYAWAAGNADLMALMFPPEAYLPRRMREHPAVLAVEDHFVPESPFSLSDRFI